MPGAIIQSPNPIPMKSHLWDLAAAVPVLLLCVFGALGFAIQIHAQWPDRFGFPQQARILSEAASAIFLAMQAGLIIRRRLPVYKAPGIAPRAWGLAGAYFSYLMLLIPKATSSPAMAIVSSILTITGTAAGICTLCWLGRSFAILPQARQLVTQGPYRWVRHPLYLTEFIAALGLSLQFRQPWALLIIGLTIGLQFPRMRYEEKALAACFPDYRYYAARTARIVPFVLKEWRFNGGGPRADWPTTALHA
jgi:protein-S-isoprenylcysteine O-methyltransferase Ste14